MTAQANTTVSDADLLPCPLCGGKARMEYYAGTAVECTVCLLHMDGLFSTPEIALAAWNRRATADVTEAKMPPIYMAEYLRDDTRVCLVGDVLAALNPPMGR